jgi:hypothetical protein
VSEALQGTHLVDMCGVADAFVRKFEQPTIAYAARGSPAGGTSGHHFVAKAIAGSGPAGGPKQSSTARSPDAPDWALPAPRVSRGCADTGRAFVGEAGASAERASAWMRLKAGAQRLEQGRRCIKEGECAPRPILALSFQITSALT